ncbi:MAG: orotate phosphoribosyltransferase [Candidatus Atabeyarchaeum deiterrae]
MDAWKKVLIELIVEKNGLLFGEFQLKSGRISPYFFNLAYVVSDGQGIAKVSEAYALAMRDQIGLNAFDYIHGPAYKAIALAGSVALELYREFKANKRWGFDRKQPKEYGVQKEKWLVGEIRDNDRILIIDDTVTTGEAKMESMEKINAFSECKGLKFVATLVMLDRMEKSVQGASASSDLKQKGLGLYSIVRIRDVFEYLKERKVKGKIYVTKETCDSFNQYFEKYGVS